MPQENLKTVRPDEEVPAYKELHEKIQRALDSMHHGRIIVEIVNGKPRRFLLETAEML